MENKESKKLTEIQKKHIEEEVKRTKEINAYLATTKMNVAVYKAPKGDKNGKR